MVKQYVHWYAENGTDALILITNRLNNEGDDVWIANAEKLLGL